jgi:O-antigen ligase
VQVSERERAVEPGRTLRFEPPGAGPGWRLTVAVVQLAAGEPLDLDAVELRSGGDQLLHNPGLRPRLCPPPPERPEPAAELAPALRWPLTLVALLLAALALRWLHRRLRGEGRAELDPRLERAVLVGVALLPFVSVGTVKVGVRLIPADLVLGVAGALIALTHLRGRRRPFDDPAALAAAGAILFAAASALALVLGLAMFSDANLRRLTTGPALVGAIGTPEQRGVTDLMRLFQGVAALYAVLALVRGAEDWLRVARIVAIGGIGLAALGLLQVAGYRLFPNLPTLPGAFEYPLLLRASGTFPEPNPYAGYLAFCAACSAVLLAVRPSRLAWAGLAAAAGGIALSRSSAGALALGVLLAGLLVARRWRIALPVVAAIAVAALGALAAGAGGEALEALNKPFEEKASVLDRQATWEGGLRMGATYAPLGVGRGQFAFNFAPFVDPEQVVRGGRAQSAAVEVWAEGGPVGLLLALAVLAAGPLWLLRRRRRDPVSLVWATFVATLAAVLLTYYTTNYAWTWVAAALAATGCRLHALKAPPER